MNKLENLIYRTQLQFQFNAILKGLSIGIGSVFLYLSFSWEIEIALLVGTVVAIGAAIYLGALKQDREKAKNTLHLYYPELEYSLDILDKENKNVADILQLKRLESQFRSKKVPLMIGQRILPAVLFLLATSGIFGMSLMGLNFKSDEISKPMSGTISHQPKTQAEGILLESIKVEIQAPSYTNQKNVIQQQFDIRALEGSRISWTLDFNSKDITEVHMIDGFGLEVKLDENAGRFQLSDRLENPGIYAIRASKNGEVVFQSDFHKLEMIKDKSPLIVPEEKEVYKYHFHKDHMQFKLKAKVSDDFLVRQVYLIATLARGSGENVKFRESKFKLTPTNFQSADIAHAMDLSAMDFKPGDELYYYWLAIDSKRPEANISKSDTYFIQFVDSTGMTDSQLESMAIHVLPDYFRSQRQIIIDTEKLLSSQKDISERKFNEDSNELGYEQKLLRMRYGQYLGEEFESNAPGGTLNTAEGRSILESFIHNHDHEGENEGSPALSKFRYAALQKYQAEHEKNQEILKQQIGEMVGADDHEHHDHGHSEDDELSGLLEEYLHNHDSEEMNTLYEQSTRSMLKMALEMMWQSELHLRLFEPKEALPFQHKALEYLKSVQQKSRVYVKKSGFEPPPIKEAEKRLTGESKDLKTLYARELSATQRELPLMASRILGILHQEYFSPDDQKVIQHFGQLWTERIGNSGMDDWNTLLLLQKLSAQEINPEEKVLLSKTLQQVTDRERRNNPNALSNQKLAKAFWENLK
jgi:hypothetical protein